ncbi:hypothetical protein [Curtobacterium sp. DN_7.5]|uniref:hypothetical protein n=1 Tax=Curtobacterium sp. DN_7.5 TaxID=3049047 RepID=UPI001F58E568|nr:hypothetical protein [Curtobacterium sp. DN_7.5]
MINAATDCSVAADTGTSSCFGTNLAGLIGLTAQSPIGTLGVLILALIAILMTFVQIALMVVRSAVLVLLPGVLPLTASFTSIPSGEQWFRRSLGWLVTFILYKPAAALIYAAAFKLIGTDIFLKDDGGIWLVMTGLALMIIALVALPALMRFIARMVALAGGGAAGAAVAGGLGIAAGELATGAIKPWPSKSSSNTSSSSSRSTSKTEASTGSTQPGGKSGRPQPRWEAHNRPSDLRDIIGGPVKLRVSSVLSDCEGACSRLTARNGTLQAPAEDCAPDRLQLY